MKKIKINPTPVLGFQPDPDFDLIIFDPTERTIVTATHLFGDRK